MEYQVIMHHGIKGMRWGIRRFQRKDGSLTSAGKKRREQLLESGTAKQLNKKKNRSLLTTDELNERIRRLETEKTISDLAKGKVKKQSEIDEKKTESNEDRRARLLKSTDPEELYKNRDVLTTNELRERMDRINVEKQLANVANSTKKTGFDKVDDVLKVARKVDEVAKFATESTLGKAIMKKIGGDKVEKLEKSLGLKEALARSNTLSDNDIKKALDRASNISKLENLDIAAKKRAKNAKEEATAEKQKAKEEKQKAKENTKASGDGFQKIMEDFIPMREKSSSARENIRNAGETFAQKYAERKERKYNERMQRTSDEIFENFRRNTQQYQNDGYSYVNEYLLLEDR